MRDNFIFLVIAICFVLALMSRVAGLYTYWWFAIFRPHDWVWGSLISDLRLPLVAALLLVIPSAIQKIYPKINHPIAVLMLLMLGSLITADLINGCSTAPIVRTADIAALFVLFFVVLLTIEIVDDKKKLFWLIAVISISLAFHSAKGGINAMLTGASYYGFNNLSGLFSGSNAFALGSGMLLFFMIFTFQFINSYLVYENKNKWYSSPLALKIYKAAFIIIIIGSFYNIVALESRGSFISTSAGLFLWILLHKYRIRMLIITTVLISVGLSVAPMPEGYEDRIASAFAEEEERDSSAASRPHFWDVAKNMVATYPEGVGPGCYPAYYNIFDHSNGLYGHYRSVHSSHFQILADAGYFGVCIWVLLFLVSYWKLYKIKKRANSLVQDEDSKQFYINIANMMTCTISVFIAGGSFYEYGYNDIIWLVFALVIAAEKVMNSEIDAKPDAKTSLQPKKNRLKRRFKQS
ncbi:O-antigen ligase family protein [Pseudomonadota bacterium]